MNLLKTTKRSTMGNELLRILMTVCSLGKDAGWDDPTKIPIEDIIELWREQSSKGEVCKLPLLGSRGPVGRAGNRPEHLSVCRIGRSSLRYMIGRNVCYRLGEPSVTGQ